MSVLLMHEQRKSESRNARYGGGLIPEEEDIDASFDEVRTIHYQF
jgi:hypothetical protein